MLKKVRNLNVLVEKFEELPFIIGIGKLSMIAVSDYSKRDYFIVRIKPKGSEISKKLGNCEIIEFSDHAKRQFLQSISKYEIVLNNKLGSIYELKGRSGYFRTKVKIDPI